MPKWPQTVWNTRKDIVNWLSFSRPLTQRLEPNAPHRIKHSQYMVSFCVLFWLRSLVPLERRAKKNPMPKFCVSSHTCSSPFPHWCCLSLTYVPWRPQAAPVPLLHLFAPCSTHSWGWRRPACLWNGRALLPDACCQRQGHKHSSSQLSNLWWMPNSLSKHFGTAMRKGSSRSLQWYPTTTYQHQFVKTNLCCIW